MFNTKFAWAETADMTTSFRYVNGIMPSDTQLTLEELDALVLNNGSIFKKDPRNILFFLQRVIKSFNTYQETIMSLNRDMAAARSASVSNMHPVDRALKVLEDLSESDLDRVLHENYVRELRKLTKLTEDNELIKLGYINESNRVRSAIATLLADGKLSLADSSLIREQLDSINYKL